MIPVSVVATITLLYFGLLFSVAWFADRQRAMGRSPIDNLYVSTGWGTGGFKAIPGGGDTLAWTIAHDQTHELLLPFSLERFNTGKLIDEGAAAGVAH